MSENLRDLLHQLAEHETTRADAAAPDATATVRHVVTDIRTRRTRRSAAISAAAVTVLAIGIATATALTPQPHDPAVVDPTPSPTSSTPTTPPPSPTPSPTSDPGAVPATSAPAPWGVVESLATPPRLLWTLTARSVLVSSGLGDHATDFVDVTTGAPYGSFSAVDAGDVLVTQVTKPEGDGTVLVGLATATGSVLWANVGDPMLWRTCAQATAGGHVVCLVADRRDDTHRIELLEPSDGTVARTFTVDFQALSLGVHGHTIVVHGATTDGTPRWDGVDALSGATLWSHVDPGVGGDEPILGDTFASTTVEGDVAVLAGDGYGVVIDARTGERTTAGVDLRGELGLMPVVWAPAPGAAVPAFERLEPPANENLEPGEQGEPGVLRALDPTDGSVLWTAGDGLDQLEGVIGGGVVVTDFRRSSYLDLVTGRALWSVDDAWVVATDGERVLLSPSVEGPVSAVSLVDGRPTWSLNVPDAFATWYTARHLAVSSPGSVHMYAW